MVRRVVVRLGPWWTAALVAALIAVLALIPVLLLTTSGAGKARPRAAIAPAPVTTAAPPASLPAAAKRRAKRAVRHARARHPAAAPHPHHHSTGAPAKSQAPVSTTRATSAGTTPQPLSAASAISFDLLGRSGDATSGVCGATRHYRTYGRGELIGLSGRVSPVPSAIWKVKVKVEVCAGASFSDLAKIEPTLDKHQGTFTGSFPAPAPGFYRARAELYVNDSITTKSTDEHFKIR